MTLQDDEWNAPQRKQKAWEKLCIENGWVCKLCGCSPALGKQLEEQLCEDCRLQMRNE